MNVKRKLKPFVIVIRSVLILGLATLTSVCHAQVGASRPTKDGSPTPVRVGIFVLNVDKIDSAEQTFSASVYLETRWHDPSLAHSRKTVKRPLDQIWHPHLQFVNQRAAWRTFPEIADVLGNGEVIYRQRVWGSFAQPLDLRAFPFDRQLLTIPIVAAGYDREEVEIVRLIPDKVGESAIAAKFSLPDWDVEKAEVSAGRYAVLPGSEGVPALVLKMEVKRNWGSFLVKVILPLCLIVAMSWICFWINPAEIGANVSVAVTSVLTIVAYRFSIGQMTPLVPYLTRMDAFIFVSMLMVFSVAGQVVVNASLVTRGRLDAAHRLNRLARVGYPVTFVGMGLFALAVL
jgi:hypothetical protein